MRMLVKLVPPQRIRNERGMTTAELLGNAALGVAALVVIWGALQIMGVHVIDWIEQTLGVG